MQRRRIHREFTANAAREVWPARAGGVVLEALCRICSLRRSTRRAGCLRSHRRLSSSRKATSLRHEGRHRALSRVRVGALLACSSAAVTLCVQVCSFVEPSQPAQSVRPPPTLAPPTAVVRPSSLRVLSKPSYSTRRSGGSASGLQALTSMLRHQGGRRQVGCRRRGPAPAPAPVTEARAEVRERAEVWERREAAAAAAREGPAAWEAAAAAARVVAGTLAAREDPAAARVAAWEAAARHAAEVAARRLAPARPRSRAPRRAVPSRPRTAEAKGPRHQHGLLGVPQPDPIDQLQRGLREGRPPARSRRSRCPNPNPNPNPKP